MIDLKGTQFEREIILWAVRWYVAYPISYRQLEEMMSERGVAVDHSTLRRCQLAEPSHGVAKLRQGHATHRYHL
jgi:transposase-like protein